MNAVVQALLHLVVDLRAKPGQAAEGGLDVPAGATETVVKVEVAKGRVQVVAPHQANDAPAEPDAFRVTGRTIDRLRGLGKFIGSALVVLGGVGTARGGLAGLILICRCAALGKRCPDTDHQCQPGYGEVTQSGYLKLEHPLKHEFPDLVPAGPAAYAMPFK